MRGKIVEVICVVMTFLFHPAVTEVRAGGEEEYARDELKLSGHVSTTFNYNFNEPDDRNNALRVFDTEHNTFHLHLFELVLEKEAHSGGVGFRVDLDYGDVAESTGSAGLGSTEDEFDLQQAYLNSNGAFGVDGLDFIAGKFVTLLGYEVIESWDNFNTSRSYLFGYAIPFTHTGILANYAVNENAGYSVGLVNGWDVTDDNNDGKTVLGRVGFSPSDRFSVGITAIYGPEQDDNGSSQRGVLDLVTTINATDRLTLGINYDYGSEEELLPSGGDATWTGVAGYAHYKVNDRWALASRLELFDDKDGARTGMSQELWEATLTNDYKISEDLLLRLEYRYDSSDEDSFTDGSVPSDSQHTGSFEFIYSF